MVQRGQDSGLALEPREAIRIASDALREHLDRHVAAESGVASTIDLAHPTGAEQGDDLVLAEARSRGNRHRTHAGRLRARLGPSRFRLILVRILCGKLTT